MPEENQPQEPSNILEQTNKESHGQSNKEIDDEIQINSEIIKKIGAFIFKHRVYLLVLIPIILTFYIRLLPAEQPITEDWARNAVYNFYRGQVDAGVSKQYPNLPDEQKNRIIGEEINKIYGSQGQIIEQQTQQVRNQFRQQYSYQSGNKLYPLLGDLDSYYWLRFARNLVEKGTICDEKIEGVCYDSYTTAPVRLALDIPTFHVYAIFILYNLLKAFNSNLSLMHASFLTPLVFAIFSAIFVFIMVKRVSGTLGALVASILVAVNPTFLSRSFGSDSDVYNVFFTVLILWLTFEAFNAKKTKNTVIFSALAGISSGIYAYAWSGWWYVFMFTLVALAINISLIFLRNLYHDKKIVLEKLIKDDFIKKSLIMFGVLLVTVGIVISIIYDFRTYIFTFTSIFGVFAFKVAGGFWPNVLTTVAEFGGSSIGSGISQAGGKFIFALAILGLIFLVYNKLNAIVKNIPWILGALLLVIFSLSNKALSFSTFSYIFFVSLPFILILILNVWKGSEEMDFRGAMLILFMIVSSLYVVTQGNRFALLLVVPVSVAVGISADYIYRLIVALVTPSIKQRLIKNGIRAVLFFVIILLLTKNQVNAGISVGKSYMPSVNKQWVDALTYIKDNSKPTAIINSWWDFGHWFKYFADRRVTLDGSSQNSPQLHWLGKLILTPDENVSVGILRMLDCGANTAFEAVDAKVNFSPKSIKILNSIIPIHNRSIAKNLLIQENFSNEEAENILKYTHCEPPENFYITSGDMVHKSGVWAHFGGWDFDRAYMQNFIRSDLSRADAIAKLQSEFNMSFESANAIYEEVKALPDEGSVNVWISPWPGYASGINACQRIANDTIACPLPQQGAMLVNLTTMDAYIPTPQGILHPNSIVYKTNDTVAEEAFENNTIGISMILISEGDSYAALFSSQPLAGSTFTRLFYLDGHALKYYKHAFDVRDATGLRIIVWKIEWP